MKPQISPFQYSILIANFLFTGTLISLPQVLVQIAEQNAWMVPFISYPIIILIIFLGIGRSRKLKNKISTEIGNSSPYMEKIFGIFMLLFLSLAFIRDVRALADFVVSSLLPSTPIEILTVLSVLTVIYIVHNGLEVITRITVIQFIVLATVIILLPFMLSNEIEFNNLQPILGSSAFPSLFQSSYLLIAWLGEVVIVFLLIPYIKPIKHIKKISILGALFAMILLFILLILELAVLGADITKVSTFPNYQLIQQINITDFLDRLDLIIVTVWAPTLFCKIALTLYCINKSLSYIKGSESSHLVLPMGLFLGTLAILLFKNNIQLLEFSFYTWATIGLFLEICIVGIFILMRIKNKHQKQKVTD
ncbi:GerAB/ArcD/ProY family transporter [Bacillus sp. PS06]|uniref:GerAB/ArcD/ProY family transporter n=1 Tax=Bacillus sp. PS06 TaxID=2764176 RepID=UPI0017803159|nr:endospore germination permease [Bacillus sp. PS06]MBD8067968.1 endospore germination permease [Bacillus sp. PS06]